MQITPLRPGGLGLDRPQASDSVAAVPRAGEAQAAAPAPAPSALPVVHAGLRGLDAQRNTRVAGAQQALDYLDRLAPRLRNLQTDLGRAAAGQPVPAERLESQRTRLDQLWTERSTAAGTALDPQLHYSADQPARRSFTVRGLDQPPQARETLTLAVGLPSAARPGVRVLLDPEATPQARADGFAQALAPLGLQAEADAAGGLRFSVAEPRWPQVRDGLALQGEGRQFAAGRLHRVAADPQPDVLTPRQWSLQDEGGARQALQQVGTALQRTEAARDGVRAVLDDDRAALAGAGPARDADWAARFGDAFAAQLRGETATRGGYGMQASLGAALWGLGRQRVERLLDAG
ncbi:hypothetical protein [Pseudorhodoferax sp. Leaf274]|uniref:hypothetical protein n=1 Tax=Pseudorhodoferax sp. Leaf274 TaxID=1736318 RepID=UPI0007035642|nr:hypothetical protein [Pseudorhodoferax sp. Leaf274]KQP37157.1 hypothetical protein ASF44_15760 [Pseudorhodoferax sp. Leaf274]